MAAGLCGRSRTLEIVCSAEDYDAATGELYGFVNRALPDAELDGFVEAFAARIASFDRKVLTACKKTINERACLPSLGELLASNHQLYEVDYNWPKPEGAFEKVMAAGLGQKGTLSSTFPIPSINWAKNWWPDEDMHFIGQPPQAWQYHAAR